MTDPELTDLDIQLKAFCSLLETETQKEYDELSSELNGFLPEFAMEVERVVTDFKASQKDKKLRFNVFDSLTRHHLEKLHSNFIANLLDVNGKHDFDDLFLKLFIETVLETAKTDDVEREIDKDIDFSMEKDLKKANVIKEKNLGEYGRADIFIESRNFNIIIENKIYASEQTDQVARYYDYCKEQKIVQNKKFWVLYLTLEGAASDTAKGNTYYRISYRNTILRWLEKCLEEAKDFPIVHTGIHFYNQLLKNNFLHLPDNQLTVNIKEVVAQKPDILKHWSELKPAVDEHIKDLQLDFFRKVHTKLLLNKHKIALRNSIHNPILGINNILDKRGNGFVFTEYVIDLSDGSKVLFAIEHNCTDIYFGVFGHKDNGMKGEITNEFYKKLSTDFNSLKIEEWWWIRNYFQPNSVSFLSDANAYYLATNMDELVTKFVLDVEAFLAAWKEVMAERNLDNKA